MKKMFKSTVAVMLAVIMVFGGTPAGTFAWFDMSWPEWLKSPLSFNASADYYSGTCGSYLTWSLVTSTGVLTISGTGAMTDWTSSSSVPWDSYRSYVKSVTIPDSVTRIGNYAFENCDNLTSITIPDSVTRIGYCAFAVCDSLTSITVDSANQHYSNDSYGVLFNKDKTNLIQYPAGNIRTSYTISDSVTSILDLAFGDCFRLTSITIPDSVTSIGRSAFSVCFRLPSVIIPNSVTSIGDSTFDFCFSLTSITIPDSVTSIGDDAFNHCSKLTSITIPNSVTSIGANAFYDTAYYNNSLNWESDEILYIGKHLIAAKHTISGNYNVKDDTICIADSAFEYCSSLTSVTIPDSVTSIGDGAFRDCSSLTSVTIPDSVTSIGNFAFSGCSSLTSVTIPDSVTSIGRSAFCDTAYYNNPSNWESNTVLYIGKHLIEAKDTISGNYNVKDDTICITDFAFAGCDSLTIVTIPDSVTSIVYAAFYNCSSLTSVTIPDSVTSIGYAAFYNCSSLTSVTIPDSVTSIGDEAFYNCTSLTSVTIPDGVASIGDEAFRSCNGLTSVTIPDSVASIGDYAFAYCNKLTSVTVGNNVTSIGDYAFEYCSSLTSVTIPDSVTSIGDGAFRDCSSLTRVTIPNSVTSLGSDAFSGCTSLINVTIPNSETIIGDHAFYNCYSLTSITIPDSVTFIGDHAFSSCTRLTSVTIGNSVMSIRDYAFAYCNKLTSVTIGNSVTSIRYAAFYCSSLKDVYYSGSESQWNAISIGSFNTFLTSATIHYNYTGSGTTVPVTGVSLDKENLTLSPTETSQITATVSPSDATNQSVTWSSSDENIAMVDANGLVTAKAAGTATITVTAGDTTNGTLSDTCTVTVANTIKIVKTTPVSGQTGVTLREDELWPRINLTFSIYFDHEIEVGTGKVCICKYGELTALKTLSRDTYEEGYIQVDPDNPKCLQIAVINGWNDSASRGTSSIPYGENLSILMDSTAVVPKDKDYTFAGINDYDTWSFTTAWGLTPDVDLLPFCNSSETNEPKLGGFDCTKNDISKALKTEILKNRKSEKKDIQKAIDSTWGGSCYGMTAVTALAKTGNINLKAWDSDADNCFELAFPKDSKGAFGTQDLINYYQLTQSFSDSPKLSAVKYFISSFMDAGFEAVLKLIVNQTKWLEVTGVTKTPFLVCFNWKDDEGSHGHACLVWGYEHTDKGYEILLYDPSAPATKTIMLITEDYEDVSLSESAWGDIDIYGISYTSPNDLIKYNLDSKASSNKSESAAQDSEDEYAKLFCYGSGNFTITNAEGETLTCSDGVFSGNIPVYSLDFTDDSEASEFRFKVNKSASFVFTSNDTAGYMSVAQDDFFASADATGTDSITITPGVGMSLSGGNVGYTVYMSFGDGAKCDMVKLIGTTGSYLNLTYGSNGEISVNADSSGNIEAEYFMDAETQTGEIETENGQAVVSDVYTTKVTNVRMSASSAFIAKGSSRQLSVVISPNDATNQSITWTSSDDSVVSVTQNGIINALSVGTATITATTEDGGYSDTCEVTVYNNVESITVASMPSLTQYNYKQSFDISGLTLTATYSDNSTQTVTDISKMTVTGYDAKKAGTQTLTVEYEGCSASINVTVKMTWWQWLIKILLFGWIWY